MFISTVKMAILTWGLMGSYPQVANTFVLALFSILIDWHFFFFFANRWSHEINPAKINKNMDIGQWHSVLLITLSNIFTESHYLGMKDLPVSSIFCNKSLACSYTSPVVASHTFIWVWYELRYEQWPFFMNSKQATKESKYL